MRVRASSYCQMSDDQQPFLLSPSPTTQFHLHPMYSSLSGPLLPLNMRSLDIPHVSSAPRINSEVRSFSSDGRRFIRRGKLQRSTRKHSQFFAEHVNQASNNLSSSLSTLPSGSSQHVPHGRVLVKGHTVSAGTPRMCSTSAQLERRHGRSCDVHAIHEDERDGRGFDNPIAQVSSDILRVSGYTQQFRSLLATRMNGRRESTPNVHLENEEDDHYVNGGVRFDCEEGDGDAKKNNEKLTKVIRRRQSGYGISITSDSTAKMRCRQRKLLFVRRNRVCDLSLVLALLGLLFVIIDSEATALQYVTKSDPVSLILRAFAVITTLALMCCLAYYHAIEVNLALIDSGAEDWRVAVSVERGIKLMIELLVCAVCPFPGSGSVRWPYINSETRAVNMIEVPVDVLLSVPMFLRSYLLCRFMVLHSKQFQDAATRSIAALNRISMDFRFVIKTMMADHPLRVLIVFTVSYWICMSWMFTQCERYDGHLEVEHYYLNSMWFIMVTFMSIGYGDIVPNTYCGRTLSIATGIVGAGVSSALIAVISRKLELSRAEKHVNNFMADSKLTNQRKNAAASVLQQTWFIHKYKKGLQKGDDLRLRHHQRRFLHSINEFRRIKWDQRKLQEKGNSLLDVGKLHSDMHETLWEMHRTQDHFISQIDMLTQKIIELQATLSTQPVNHSSLCCHSPSTLQVSPSMTPSLPSQTPLVDFSQSHREPLMQESASIPRINVSSNGHANSNGTPLAPRQLTARSAVNSFDSTSTTATNIVPNASVYTNGGYIKDKNNVLQQRNHVNANTPLMSSFEEV